MPLHLEIYQVGVSIVKQGGSFFKFWLGPDLKVRAKHMRLKLAVQINRIV